MFFSLTCLPKYQDCTIINNQCLSHLVADLHRFTCSYQCISTKYSKMGQNVEKNLSLTSTHIQLTDSAGQSLVRTSCGTEGFKNIKKSTPIAAQTAGISAAVVSFLLRCSGKAGPVLSKLSLHNVSSEGSPGLRCFKHSLQQHLMNLKEITTH